MFEEAVKELQYDCKSATKVRDENGLERRVIVRVKGGMVIGDA